MPDLIEQLAGLHRDDLPPVTDDVVVADLSRGRRAVRRRRIRHGATTVMSAGLVAVVAGVAFGFGGDTGGSRPPATADGTVSSTSDPASAVALVAWNGDQLPGFAVDYVPEGFVLQGVSDSVLDIARPDDTTPIDTFVGKLVVMLDDHPDVPSPGDTAIVVGGHKGWYSNGDGATVIAYNDGTHDVVIQAWDSLGLNRLQLIQFAEGVTVSATAVPGHG